MHNHLYTVYFILLVRSICHHIANQIGSCFFLTQCHKGDLGHKVLWIEVPIIKCWCIFLHLLLISHSQEWLMAIKVQDVCKLNGRNRKSIQTSIQVESVLIIFHSQAGCFYLRIAVSILAGATGRWLRPQVFICVFPQGTWWQTPLMKSEQDEWRCSFRHFLLI